MRAGEDRSESGGRRAYLSHIVTFSKDDISVMSKAIKTPCTPE